MFEVTTQWPLLSGGFITLIYKGETTKPSPEEFVQMLSYLDVWAGGTVLDSFRKEIQSMTSNFAALLASLAALQEDVAAQTTVTESVLTLVDGLQNQIATLKISLETALADSAALPEVVAQLDGINAALDAQRERLANAVIANTPAVSTGASEEPIPEPVLPEVPVVEEPVIEEPVPSEPSSEV